MKPETPDFNTDVTKLLTRIADSLERLAPAPEAMPDLKAADQFIWHGSEKRLAPVQKFSYIPISLLQGIDFAREKLLTNTRQFAHGLPANNVLLWGARGTGKSSLIKSVFAAAIAERPKSIALIECHRDELASLPYLLDELRRTNRRFILFFDDLSFEREDASFKSLKAILDGSIDAKPEHVVCYATSNRRHLIQRDAGENEREVTPQNPTESAEEKISLSDRFGLSLGFYPCTPEDYLRIVDAYSNQFSLSGEVADRHRYALEWASARGSFSGRVAWQYVTDLAGRQGRRLFNY